MFDAMITFIRNYEEMKCSQKIYTISETGTDTLEKYHFCFDI